MASEDGLTSDDNDLLFANYFCSDSNDVVEFSSAHWLELSDRFQNSASLRFAKQACEGGVLSEVSSELVICSNDLADLRDRPRKNVFPGLCVAGINLAGALPSLYPASSLLHHRSP